MSWLTSAMCDSSVCVSSVFTSWPPTRMLPDWGTHSRSSRRTMVDLPAPLGPTMPTRSPAAMLNARP
ncbi:hypothetical protein G6F23_015792 [Rhizopus arrhizus]|nr:hypothetical protein G6F23_015792 [Rhizopus arrhizus]